MEEVEAKDITEVQEVTEAIIVDAAELATGPALNEVMLAVNLAVAVVVEEKAVKEAPEANEAEEVVVDLIEADKEVMGGVVAFIKENTTTSGYGNVSPYLVALLLTLAPAL